MRLHLHTLTCVTWAWLLASVPTGAVPAFVRGPARFQVLAPALVRLEYSPSGAFVDTPSVAVINRQDWPQTQVQSGEEAGWLVLDTGVLSLRFKLGSGPFTTNNLRIEWRDGSGAHQWKPGDADDQNLGGVPGELGNRSTKVVTDPGPLSRKGCYLLDDSKTALFDKASDWVKPGGEGQPGLVLPRVWGRLQVRLEPIVEAGWPRADASPLRLWFVVRVTGGLLRRGVEDDREAVPRRATPAGHGRD